MVTTTSSPPKKIGDHMKIELSDFQLMLLYAGAGFVVLPAVGFSVSWVLCEVLK